MKWWGDRYCNGLNVIAGAQTQYAKETQVEKAAAKQLGVTIKEVLWLQGQYDIVVISEGSDEIGMNALSLNTLKLGNVHGQTMRAFTAAEMAKILEKVS